MKYLTKEWYLMDELSDIYEYMKESERAERKGEQFYIELYQSARERYVNEERADEAYYSPDTDMRLTERYLNEEGLSEQKREARKIIQTELKEMYARREANGQAALVFDEKMAERRFDEIIRRQIDMYEYLPREILDKVADIRVMALGYVSAEVKRLLKPYCKNLKQKRDILDAQAAMETEQAEKLLSAELDVHNYKDLQLMGIEERDGDLFLEFDFGDKLYIKDGKILEQEQQKIYPWNADIPNSGWSRVRAAELQRIGERFEISFLMENKSEYEEITVWYLTLQGTDMREIIAEKNLPIQKLYERLK